MVSNKRKKSIKKIILTGGHAATTAISAIEELVRRSNLVGGNAWQIYWIGTKEAIEGKKIPTLESEFFSTLDVSYHSIMAGRIQRKFTLWTIPALAKIPLGFFQALKLVGEINPDVILSFGGFAGFPVVLAGFLFGVPIVIHDQTAQLGRANKFSQVFAKKIALAKESSLRYVYDKKKAVVVGNPILTQVALIEPKERMGNPPTLYVTGGSRGSQALNCLIVKIIKKLLSDFVVIHQTGHLDYRRIFSIKSKLPKKLQEKYEVYPRIDPMQIDGVFKRADIIVARAGANTVSEIIITKRPAILIPLPISHQGDQFSNAKIAENFGVAKVLIQGNLTARKLLKEIDKTRGNWQAIVDKITAKKSPDVGASARLVDLVEKIIN